MCKLQTKFVCVFPSIRYTLNLFGISLHNVLHKGDTTNMLNLYNHILIVYIIQPTIRS
jgi:hypothetical protein